MSVELDVNEIEGINDQDDIIDQPPLEDPDNPISQPETHEHDKQTSVWRWGILAFLVSLYVAFVVSASIFEGILWRLPESWSTSLFKLYGQSTFLVLIGLVFTLLFGWYLGSWIFVLSEDRVFVTKDIYGRSRNKGPGLVFIAKPLNFPHSVVDISEFPMAIRSTITNTNDGFPVYYNANLFYTVSNPRFAVFNVNNLIKAIHKAAETKIVKVIQKHEYQWLTDNHDKIEEDLLKLINKEISTRDKPWGIKVLSFELSDAIAATKKARDTLYAPASATLLSQSLSIQADGEAKYVKTVKDALEFHFQDVPQDVILQALNELRMAGAIEKGGQSGALVSVGTTRKIK